MKNYEKPMIEDMDEMFALLEMLKMSLRSHNSDQSDKIMKQIMAFRYPDDIQVKIDQLNIHILNFEEDEAFMDIDVLQM